MNLHQGIGHVDWHAVISDMRQACALKPDDVLFSVNLTQALLDSKQVQKAYEVAKQASSLHPDAYQSMEKLALAAFATRRWAEAYSAVLHAQKMLGQEQPLPEQATRLLADLSSRWWEPIAKGGVVLRCPDTSDASFLGSTFQDKEFMLHYHRFQRGSGDAVARFIAKAQLPPRQSRRIDWIVLDSGGDRVGVAAIVDIDWYNQRGELLIGIPGKRSNMIAIKATFAALEFAFKRLHLAKMMIYVYADNPPAQDNTLHLGFEQEGLLRSHIASQSGRIDLFVNGMTSAGFASNVLLNKLARRW